MDEGEKRGKEEAGNTGLHLRLLAGLRLLPKRKGERNEKCRNNAVVRGSKGDVVDSVLFVV